MKNNNSITVMAQAFYGNRTQTQINKDQIDRFILGYIDDSVTCNEKNDRSIVRIPDSENLVLVYNKYEEEQRLNDKKQYFERDGYVLKPLVIIPKISLELYSRCIVCRMNDIGELESLQNEDYDLFVDYLSE